MGNTYTSRSANSFSALNLHPHLISLDIFSYVHNNTHFDTLDQEKQSHVSETEILSVEERDVLALARLGKKPILKVCLAIPNLLVF